MKSNPKDPISSFPKYNCSRLGLKQEDLAKRAGVGIRFLRELEQGKESLKMDKVNKGCQVIHLIFTHLKLS
jgi:transcriptional regulator with XRE-family HTH domain